MSGHSKWSTIKREKGANDQKRGQIFTKLGKAITIAVKDGGGITDPDKNFKLRLTIDKAREANMPKDNIKRALLRHSANQGKLGGGGWKEVLYEGYGPFGIAIIIEAVTDNKKRTSQELKRVFERGGGRLASTGAVNYLFERKGLIVIEKKDLTEDQVLEKALEAGAEDLEETEDGFEIFTEPQKLNQAKEKIKSFGLKIIDSELSFRPKSTVSITGEEKAKKILKLMDAFESLDDVQKVYANFDLL
ncbi:YebC/PmpR family DNA-binding transcriptional regulator [Candidatus Microgenomates bacterium]|nr:YebC/PmpR family DNA-binding transcriptional regulator [Candidatus Microgenomates bacterium]